MVDPNINCCNKNGLFGKHSIRLNGKGFPISDETVVTAWGSTAIGWQPAAVDFSAVRRL
jgi:hypothetical protein